MQNDEKIILLKLVAFATIIFIIIGLILCVWASFTPTSTGKVISINRQWHSGNYTYTNFTFSSIYGNQNYVVKCDFYSLNQTIEIATMQFYSWILTYYPFPEYGC